MAQKATTVGAPSFEQRMLRAGYRELECSGCGRRAAPGNWTPVKRGIPKCPDCIAAGREHRLRRPPPDPPPPAVATSALAGDAIEWGLDPATRDVERWLLEARDSPLRGPCVAREFGSQEN